MGKKDKTRCRKCGGELIEIDERKDGIVYQCSDCSKIVCVRGKSHFKPERKAKEINLYEE